jgi:hypothetical protein
VTDPETGDIVTLTYTVEPPEGKSYFLIDSLTGDFRVTDKKGLLSSSVLSYIIKVFLKD